MVRLLLVLLFSLGLVAREPVVILSFDGFGADRFTAQATPGLWKLAQAGWQGRGLPPFPSTTFNGHATLATGCGPERHGIVANAFVDPEAGFVAHGASPQWLQAEPLWIAATRAGLKAAVWHWPCGEGPWRDLAPWRLEPYRSGRSDAEALAFAGSALADGADLVMVYLSGVDGEGHRHGPGSPEVAAKLAALDALTTPWIEAQRAAHPNLRLWLLADHGMATMKRRIHVPTVLEGIPARVVAHGGSATIYLERAEQRRAARRLLKAAGLTAWTREALPTRFRLKGSPRVGDLVVLAPVGTWLSGARTPEEDRNERLGRSGAHAYRGNDPTMPTLMVLLGAGQGRLGDIPLWDIAPTVAQWLGLRWEAPRDGRPIPVLTRPAPARPGPGRS